MEKSTNRGNPVIKILIACFLSVVWSAGLQAQTDVENNRIDIDLPNATVKELFAAIENKSSFRFFYDAADIDVDVPVNVNYSSASIDRILKDQLDGMVYEVNGNKIVVKSKSPNEEMQPQQEQQPFTVTGVVLDASGEPIIGASVVTGSGEGTVTDVNGRFQINVPADGSLTINYLGYKQSIIQVRNRTTIDVVLEEAEQLLEEVVVVGYGVQKKATLTGAVSAVKGSEIVTTKNENMQNMLTGKLPGVRVFEKTSEPGAFNATFDIRGFGTPLVVIDGIPTDLTAFQRLDPNDIENISILKDASAAVYGVRAANGVLLVTTNRGQDTGGKISLNYSGRVGWKFPSGSPKSFSVADWMVLKNEKMLRNVNADNVPTFSQEEIQAYRDGTKQGYDWYDIIMQTAAPETQHNININGGNNKVNYFISGGYLYNESFLRSNDYNYERYNMRSNITANVTNRFKVSLNMYGMMDIRKQGASNAERIIYEMQRNPPIMPIYVDADQSYLYYGIIEGDNPYATSHSEISGYRQSKIMEFNGQVQASYQIPYIDGLSANGRLSYRHRANVNARYEKTFEMFLPNEATGDIEYAGSRYSPSIIRREYYERPQMLYNISLDYKRTFKDAHSVSALLLWEGSKRKGDNFYAQRDLDMYLDYLFAGNTTNQQGSMSSTESNFYDKANQALVGRLGYDFKSKYLLEFAFRYDGSSVWAENGRWGFFPSVSGGWRVSEENFWKNSVLNIVSNVKLRGSYGQMGDDQTAEGYTWFQGWNYPATGGSDALTVANNRVPNGYYFNGVFYNAVNSRGIINSDITWMLAKTLNAGIDADAWNGLLGASFDYFKRDRSGILTTQSGNISSTLGATMPQENLNSDRTIGFELELRHRNKINDFIYGVSGMVAYTRNMRLHREIARAGNSYLNWTRWDNENRYQGIHTGYGAAGRFQSYDEIANALVYYARTALPGDYIYEDWNGDGRIDGLDTHPLAYEQNVTPPLYFSLTLMGEWKGFDLNMLFQGAGMSYVRYVEQFREPGWGNENSNAPDFFLDRWQTAQFGVNPFDHTTTWISGLYGNGASTGLPNQDSEHNLHNTSYLRLKTIELGYSIPDRPLRKLGLQGVRLHVNSYNLLTIKNKNLKSDPEHTVDSYSMAYPISKSFSVGFNIKF